MRNARSGGTVRLVPLSRKYRSARNRPSMISPRRSRFVAETKRTSTRFGLSAPRRSTFTALEDAKQLRPDGHRDLAHLVEEHRPAIGRLREEACLCHHRAGERAAFVPEQLALEDRLGQRSAVELQEGHGGAERALVDLLGKHFLARAGLTEDEDRERAGRQDVEEAVQAQHRGVHDDGAAGPAGRRHGCLGGRARRDGRGLLDEPVRALDDDGRRPDAEGGSHAEGLLVAGCEPFLVHERTVAAPCRSSIVEAVVFAADACVVTGHGGVVDGDVALGRPARARCAPSPEAETDNDLFAGSSLTRTSVARALRRRGERVGARFGSCSISGIVRSWERGRLRRCTGAHLSRRYTTSAIPSVVVVAVRARA